MEQNIDELAQEMTDFCSQNLAFKDSLPIGVKNKFIRNPRQFLDEHWNSFATRYPSSVTTLVMISLLVGGVDGGWCGARWLRV